MVVADQLNPSPFPRHQKMNFSATNPQLRYTLKHVFGLLAGEWTPYFATHHYPKSGCRSTAIADKYLDTLVITEVGWGYSAASGGMHAAICHNKYYQKLSFGIQPVPNDTIWHASTLSAIIYYHAYQMMSFGTACSGSAQFYSSTLGDFSVKLHVLAKKY